MLREVFEPVRRRESVRDDDGAQVEEALWDDCGFLSGDDDAYVEVALLANDAEKGVCKTHRRRVVHKVLKVD